MAELQDDSLSERARHLLRVLVESYIREGQPVGSRSLSRDSGLNLSAATVRNVMADLEEYGFVTSPHTSSGRIPTDKGYRFFVDTLLRQRQPPSINNVIEELNRRLEQEEDRDPKALVAVASQVLSSLKMQLGSVAERVDAPVRERVERAIELVDTSMLGIRNLTQDLRPSLLDDLGLLPALRSLVADFEERHARKVVFSAPAALPGSAFAMAICIWRTRSSSSG